jgi:hypothetical protein
LLLIGAKRVLNHLINGRISPPAAKPGFYHFIWRVASSFMSSSPPSKVISHCHAPLGDAARTLLTDYVKICCLGTTFKYKLCEKINARKIGRVGFVSIRQLS